MKAQQSITSLPPSPDEERRGRMIRYALAMGVRILCLIGIVLVHDWWWIVLFATGAILIPYVAVVFANTRLPGLPGRRARPGALELPQRPLSDDSSRHPDQQEEPR